MKKKNYLFITLSLILIVGLSVPILQLKTFQLSVAEKVAMSQARPDDENDFEAWVKEGVIRHEEAINSASFFSELAPVYLVAKVIYRPTTQFHSYVWIDVGTDDNLDENAPIISKNSPVCWHDSLVGVIDYVGKKASLVRLITDTGFHPAVRVKRGPDSTETRFAISHITKEIAKEKSPLDHEEKKQLLRLLLKHQESLSDEKHLLAKGYLSGASSSLLTGGDLLLKGEGFTYDFSDHHGPSRDLRTGEVHDKSKSFQAMPLIEIGDLLVTSGFDGIFPEGLKVARVSYIEPLQEGGYMYELLAKPTCTELNELSFVTVLAPSRYTLEDIPDKATRIVKQLDILSND